MLEEADIDSYLSSGTSEVDWRKKIIGEHRPAVVRKSRMNLKHVNMYVPPIIWVKAGDAAQARGIPLYVWCREALARQIERDLGISTDVLLADAPAAVRDYGKTAWQRAKEAEDAGT